MGFFDNLFSPFTGTPAIEAAAASGRLLGGIYEGLSNRSEEYLDKGLEGLDAAQQNIKDYSMPLYGNARNDISQGADAGIEFMQSNFTDPLNQTQSMVSNALGLNGAGGNAAATNAFQAGPGYQFQLGQGLDAVARNANAAGMVASGNQLTAAQEYGSGLANQEYGNWLKNLQGREGLYAPIAARQGDMYAQEGKDLASLDLNQAAFGERLYGGFAKDKANLGLGHLQAQANLGGTFGPAIASTMMTGAQAQQQAGQNTWNAIGSTISGIADFFNPFD